MKHVKMETGCKGGSALCTCKNKSESKKCIRLSERDDSSDKSEDDSNDSKAETEVDSDSSRSWVQDSDGDWVQEGCGSGLESEGACDC